MHLPCKYVPTFRTLVAACGLTLLLVASGCRSAEFDAVKEYKGFLEKAKPSLTAMNAVREEMYKLEDPDQIAARFGDGLLPNIQKVKDLAAEQPRPDGRLGEIHVGLQQTLQRYAESTQRLVDKLKAKGTDEDREHALVAWGEDDQKFGREMSQLVDDLSKHLDNLKK